MNIDVELVWKPPYFHYIKPENNNNNKKNNIDLLFPWSQKHQENQIVQSEKLICQVSVLLKIHLSLIRLNLEVRSSECIILEMKSRLPHDCRNAVLQQKQKVKYLEL